MKITKGRFYQSRNGLKVRIYATDGDCPDSIHGAIWICDGWVQYSWLKNGRTGLCKLNTDIVGPWVVRKKKVKK